MKKLSIIIALLTLSALLAACGATQPATTQTPADMEATQVAQYVEQTRVVNQAVQTQVQATQVVAMTETATNQPTATATLLPPTATNTPLPTNTATPTATSTPTICNAAQLLADITVESETVFPAGARFYKVWRVKNVGSCTWTTDYSIVWNSGRPLAGHTTTLTKKVAPGETIDIAVAMKAPNDAGTHKGYWLLENANGNTFGTGSSANKPLEVKIKVTDETYSYVYDFADHICSATWKNDDGTLYCGGSSDIYKDYVRYATSFQMETGKWEDEPAILATISKQERIRGKFPAIEVHSGDHFVAEVGCLYGSTDCKVVMRLSYDIKGGGSGVLGEWQETYDGSTTLIDVDLSSLAGKEVIFTLDMETKTEVKSHQVFWFLPSIRNP